MTRNIAVLAVFFLSGCAIVQRPYVPPKSGDVAYLRVVRSEGAPASASQLGIAIFKQAESCRERYWLQTVTQSADVTKSFARVPTGAPVSVAIHEPLGGSLSHFEYCVPIAMFTPEPGRYYRATVSAAEQVCQLDFESSDSSSMTNARREPFKKKIFHNGMDENSSFCSPD